MMRPIVAALLLAAAVTLWLWAVDRALSRPSVYMSWSEQACAEVEPAWAGSCDDLPDDYVIVWVR